MKWLCQLRLLCLLSIPTVALTVGRPSSPSSLLDVSRLRGSAFSWDYNDGGQSWKGSCGNTDQSPVNISTTTAANPTDDDTFFFNYPESQTPLKMVNDGRFLYAFFDNSDDKMGGVSLGTSYPHHLTVEYHIYKILIHTPSEHTFQGVKVPLEVQLFHRKEHATLTDGEPKAADTAVVAIGFHESVDEASPFLRSLIDGGLPDQRGGTTLVNRAYPSALKFSSLFKPVFGAQGEEAGFWEYTGSLTQPPCSGGVRWFLRGQPINAKRKTLEYFTDVVEKSSGGMPGSARDLQVMGPRPVFPRLAVNAVHMTVFDPQLPAAFTDAYNRAKEHQQAFRDGLESETSGSDAAIEEGTDAVAASNDYQDCLNQLSGATEEIETAKLAQTNECNKAEGYQKTVDSIAGGPARIEAATKAAAQLKSCDDSTSVLSAKEGQKEALEKQCNTIKSDVKEKAESAK